MIKTVQQIASKQGTNRVGHLARQSALSLRQYQRQFSEEIGLNPKLFARITRFQLAIDAKRLSPHRSWLSVAHQFGYFDRMHMVRNFQIWVGMLLLKSFNRVVIYNRGPWLSL